MMAPKLRFSRGLKAKAPGAVTACVPAATPLVEIFTGPSTELKKQRWWRWGFFLTFEGLFKIIFRADGRLNDILLNKDVRHDVLSSLPRFQQRSTSRRPEK